MDLQENVDLRQKTTMRIGGIARFYVECASQQDAEQAMALARECGLPFILLGGGSNTVFHDNGVNAVVARIAAKAVTVDGDTVTAQAGAFLGSLVADLAKGGLNLSALTGIPGTLGGAIVGNAGQGAGGIWMDRYVRSVTAYIGGAWHELPAAECGFGYRESRFKHEQGPVVVWSAILDVPRGEPAAITAEIERLLQKRIETQPHLKTAGSCFKSLPDGTPAWKLIDAAGLRGFTIGGIQVSEKHANFLLNIGDGTFADAVAMVEKLRKAVPALPDVEMRFVNGDGTLAF